MIRRIIGNKSIYVQSEVVLQVRISVHESRRENYKGNVRIVQETQDDIASNQKEVTRKNNNGEIENRYINLTTKISYRKKENERQESHQAPM